MDNETRAEALVYAAYTSDPEASRQYGITERTIRNWRKALEDDAELSALFHIKRKEFGAKFQDGLEDTIEAAIRFVKRATSSMNTADPVCVDTMANAIKTLNSVRTTRLILDARMKAEQEAKANPGSTSE
jgi:3-methyladenine DNA glycosylase AlkD